jgi:carbamoylphosphate synthase large subunit
VWNDIPIATRYCFDPNAQIANSAATVHSTPHSIGLANVKEAERSDVITMGNGGTEQANKIADIKGMMCNKYGVEMG